MQNNGSALLSILLLVGCGGLESELVEQSDSILGGSPVGDGEYASTGFVSHHPNGPPNGRLCTATRLAPNVVLTAGHCVTDSDASNYSFGQGPDTDDGARYEQVLEMDVLTSSGFDLALLRTRGCGRRVARIADHHGLDDDYVLSTYLHTNNTRNGPRRKVDPYPLGGDLGAFLRVTIPCGQASIWGGDSGSPMFDSSGSADRAVDRVIGVARSVSNFCQNGANTQTIYHVKLAGAAEQRIGQTLRAWTKRDCALSADEVGD